MIEERTNEFRWLDRTTLQQRWTVQCGPTYRADKRRETLDRQVGNWHPIAPEIGFLYAPMELVWRDVPQESSTT